MKIALGVSGGVAAYKAAELVRRLQQEKLDVQVVMTRSAQEFVAPLTFAALTGQKVITEMFSAEAGAPANVESAIEHIAVAQRIDLLVIAPATANVLAKLARGIADDFLTTLHLATTAPVVVAPAMNVNMWEHPATQENVEALRARGVRIVEPDEGYLACGMTGAGRLAGVEAIARAVCEVLGIRHDFDGETALVTAGPTCEDLDPVRFLTNRSSGKMGYALADAAGRRGARVILISGPTALEPPAGVELVSVRTTEEMYRAVLERATECTVVIKAAAVADYRPVSPHSKKLDRSRLRARAREAAGQARRLDCGQRRHTRGRRVRPRNQYRLPLRSGWTRAFAAADEQVRRRQPHSRRSPPAAARLAAGAHGRRRPRTRHLI